MKKIIEVNPKSLSVIRKGSIIKQGLLQGKVVGREIKERFGYNLHLFQLSSGETIKVIEPLL